MYKKILAISFTAFLVSACGGSSGGGGNNDQSTPVVDNTPNTSDSTPVADTTPEVTIPLGGQAGTIFGDSAAASNGIDGTFEVCPANITGSFSGFAENNGGFCVPRCPGGVTLENDDNDEFATFVDGTDRLTCLVTTAASGVDVSVALFAPINGCPDGGCEIGTFPQVLISANAGSELAGSYTCTAWLFNETNQTWAEEAGTAPFALTLNTDNTAEISGTTSTWSFSSGVLTIEGNRTFQNVAVGAGTFSSYASNTSLTRCIR